MKLVVISLILFTSACRGVAPADAVVAAAGDQNLVVDLSSHFEGVDGTFVVAAGRGGTIHRHRPERAALAFLPASTFKIPNTLIGLESGVIPDADFTLSWDAERDPAADWWPPAWRGENDLRSAFSESVVWWYQEVARRIGPERMQQYVDRFDYGNRSLEGGIDQFWLSGGMRISADEQIEFLRGLYFDELGVSRRSKEILREVMLLEQEPGLRLSGKTGTAPIGEGRSIGWLVGWLEGEDEVWFYALNVEMEGRVWSRTKRQQKVRAMLEELGIVDSR